MSTPGRGLSGRFRSAFVTGASSGLGQAFVRMLLAEGVAVWGTARSLDRLQAFAAEPAFHPVTLDLADPLAALAGYARARDEAGGFDLVINNAGYGVFAAYVEEPFEVWQAQVEAMLLTPMRLAHRVLEDFRARPGGRGTLVNVTSLAVEFPLPYMSGYNVVKAALAALSESLLIELADTGCTVVDFRPGDYRTAFNRSMSPLASSAPSGSRPAARERVWRVLESNLAAAPEADQAAADLRRALRRGVRGIVRSGSFFQATLAPRGAGLLPEAVQRWWRWRYFGHR